MPAERLSMRKTKEVLRLKWHLALTARQVAGSVGMGKSTVGEYLRGAEAAGFLPLVLPQPHYELLLVHAADGPGSHAPTPSRTPGW
jgi:hypothetical protein